MNRRVGVLVVVLLTVSGVVWQLSRRDAVDPGIFVASGTVEATSAHLGFLVSGRVASVEAAEGTRVRRGTPLARLDVRTLEAEVEAGIAEVEGAQATLAELEAGTRTQELAQAEAALRSAERRAEEARDNAERALTLFDGGALSRQAWDRAVTERDVAEANATEARERLSLLHEGPRVETIRGARARVAQAQARLERAKTAVADAVIEAPFDGVVTVRHREPGEVVGAGSPVLTLLDPSDRWVRIYIPGERLGGLRLGDSAEIVSDTYPDRVVTGEVVFIGSEAEFTPRNVQTAEERTRLVYPVKVRILGDTQEVLKPGLPADVTLQGAGG